MGRKNQPTVDPSRLLDIVPAANSAVRVERHGDQVVLFVPIRKRWWMNWPLSWVLPFRNEKGIALDRLGREVWDACDGTRTLEQIIEAFADRHRLRFHEARLSVTHFLRSLVERNLVVLVSRDPAEAG